jgi:hypothetical protein
MAFTFCLLQVHPFANIWSIEQEEPVFNIIANLSFRRKIIGTRLDPKVKGRISDAVLDLLLPSATIFDLSETNFKKCMR